MRIKTEEEEKEKAIEDKFNENKSVTSVKTKTQKGASVHHDEPSIL